MAKRENAFVEAMKFVKELNAKAKEKNDLKIQKENAKTESFYNNYYNIIDNRKKLQAEKASLLENAMNNNLATAIKGIYITALEANTLTDDAIILAEGLVDNWIRENGGALKIMRENKNKTYLLDTMFSIVEKASEEDVKAIFEAEKDEDITKTDEDLANDESETKDGESNDNESDTTDKDSTKDSSEESKDDTLDMVEDDNSEKSEEDEESEKSESDGEDDTLDMVEDKSEEEDIDSDEIIDNDENEIPVESEDDTLDMVEDDSSDDEPAENIETDPEDEDLDGIEDDIEDDIETEVPDEVDQIGVDVLKDLDKEDDVQKAVATIRQRVADAEETFIKNNAKDKEQINDLLAKISDNIKTVEDMSDKDKEAGKDKIAEESVMLAKRKINDITNNRPVNIFERFCRNINKEILNESIDTENYLSEDGNIEMEFVVESAKVMYGFLETLNTIQLAKIDKEYLEKII